MIKNIMSIPRTTRKICMSRQADVMIADSVETLADPVARFVGWNDSTGGKIPQNEPIVIQTVSGFPLSNENTSLAEMLRAGTGQENTSHNLYFLNFNNFQPYKNEQDRFNLIQNYWNGETPILVPARTYSLPSGKQK